MTTLAETAASILNISFTGRQNAVCGCWVDGQGRHELSLLDPSPHGNRGNKRLYLTCPRGRGRYGGRRLKMGKMGLGEEYVGRR